MRWGQGWPKRLYVLVIVKTWNFTERSFYKDLTYSSKVKHIKIYPDIMIKTSRFHHWVNIGDFIAIWNCFCLLRLILETTPRITSQNHRRFWEKYLRWSFVIVKPLPLSFTVILLMFLKLIFLKLMLLKFIMIYEDLFLILLILVFSQPYIKLKYTEAVTGGVL